MSKKHLFILWGVLFILCAGLGFIPAPEGVFKGVMTALAVVFFVPGAVLLVRAKREQDDRTVKLIRNLSAGSLGMTVLALVANFLSLGASDAVGDGLYAVLVIVSSPMVCGGYWLLSLFLWACLLVVSIDILHKKK